MKNKKGLKIFLIIIVLVIVILAIHLIRNFMIINKINKKQEELSKSNNYFYAIESNAGTTTEVYYKDGISKNIIKTKDTTMITWYDEKTRETITYSPQTMKASVGTGFGIVQLQTLNTGNNFILALLYNISSDEVNGEKVEGIGIIYQKHSSSSSSNTNTNTDNQGTVKDPDKTNTENNLNTNNEELDNSPETGDQIYLSLLSLTIIIILNIGYVVYMMRK